VGLAKGGERTDHRDSKKPDDPPTLAEVASRSAPAAPLPSRQKSSADRKRIMEIDENLVRADLSPAERAAHQAERKKLYEREFPQTRNGAVGGGHPRQLRQNGEAAPRYTADTAKKIGTSERTVRREVELPRRREISAAASCG
jgi:hypothetical protein